MSAPGRRTVLAGGAADLMRRSRFTQHLRATFTVTSGVARKGFTATPLFVVAGRDGVVATVNCV